MTKRNFLKYVVNSLIYISTISLIYPAIKFIFYNTKKMIKYKIPLKRITKIHKVTNPALFIVKKDKEIEVFDAHCTHMGCILNFDKRKSQFTCPCHKSKFDINGKRLSGPAKRDLDKITYKIEKDILKIG